MVTLVFGTIINSAIGTFVGFLVLLPYRLAHPYFRGLLAGLIGAGFLGAITWWCVVRFRHCDQDIIRTVVEPDDNPYGYQGGVFFDHPCYPVAEIGQAGLGILNFALVVLPTLVAGSVFLIGALRVKLDVRNP